MKTRRHVNMRFLVCMFAALVLLAVGAHFLHAFQVKRTSSFLRQQAEAAQKQAKEAQKDKDLVKAVGYLSKAIGYYSRYLALNPNDSSAQAELGMLMSDEKIATTPRALQRAWYVLMRSLILDPSQHDVRRQAIKVAMNLGYYKDAEENIDRLNTESGTTDAELCGWRAQCYLVDENFSEARKKYKEAIEHSKKHVEHFVQLAALLREQPLKSKGADKSVLEVEQAADKTIEDMLDAFPESFLVRLYSAGYHRKYTAEKYPEKAEQIITRDLEKAAALGPNEVEVLLACAEWELEQERPLKARPFLETGVKEHPKEWRFYRTLARLEMEAQQPAAAMAVLQGGLTHLPNQVDLIWNLAHLHLQNAEHAEAESLIERLSKQGLDKPKIEYLQCRLLVSKKAWSQAAGRLERLYPQLLSRQDRLNELFSPNLAQECSFLLARCYESLRNPDRASEVYSQIIAKLPTSLAARLGLARMEWASGRPDSALRQYQQILLRDKVPVEALIECCQLMITQNLNNPKADWSEVDQLLTRAAKIEPLPVDVPLLQCNLILARDAKSDSKDAKRFDTSRELLLKIETYADPSKRPVEIWVGLSNIEAFRGSIDGALGLLNEAERHTGDRVELRLARIRYLVSKDYLLSKGSEAVLLSLEKLGQGVERWTANDRQRLEEHLARAYFAIGKKELAQDKWREIAKERPDDVGSRLALFETAQRLGDAKAMDDAVDQLQLVEGDEGTLWKYCRASRLIAQAEKQKDNQQLLRKASDLLSDVAKQRSSWLRVPVAQAHIQELSGNFKGAIDKYREAMKLGDRSPMVIRRLIVLYYNRGRYDEADEMLKRLVAQGESLGDLNQVAAEVAIARNEPGNALNHAANADLSESKDPRDHLWLGHILEAANKRKEAEASFRKALELDPKSPEPWVALIRFHVRGGDKAEAKLVLDGAYKNLPRETSHVPLAWGHELLGEVEKAEHLYEQALAAKPKDVTLLRAAALFYLRTKKNPLAQKHLEKIVELKADSPQEAQQARQWVALLMSLSGGYQEKLKAIEYLGVVEGGLRPEAWPAGFNVDYVRTQAIILAQQPDVGSRRQAIAIFENIAKVHDLAPDEQFLLAQLYEAVGEWPKARGKMWSLIAATQEKLEKATNDEARLKTALGTYLTHLCTSLWRRDELGEAQRLLVRLEKLEPDSFRTLGTKARLLSKQGEAKAAIEALIELAEKKPELTGPTAKLLEEINKQQEAEKMFRKYVTVSEAESPESVLVLAQFLGRRDRIDEALAICQKALLNCKPEAVAEAGVLIVYSPKADDKHWRLVANWIEEALAKKPSSTVLLSHLGAVRRLQKDYQSVIDLTQRILQEKANDTIAMNNLAWLLVLYSKDTAGARERIERAIEIEGPKDWLLDTYAVVLMKDGNPTEAVKHLKDAVVQAPSAHRYFHLAQAHLQAKNLSAALIAYQEAKRLGLTEGAVDPLELVEFRQLQEALDPKTKKDPKK